MGKAVLIFSLLIAVFVQPVQKHKEPGSIFPLNGNVTVIYDNDDFRDVYTDEYLLALSALKEIRLKGMITTYSPREYKSFVAGRKAIMEISEQSGIKYLPELLTGTDKKLIRPENSRMEDTTPLDIEGSRIIVINALKASTKKPVVIITGGQLTTVANAWLLDPSISDKVVVMGVFGAEKIDYNAVLVEKGDGKIWQAEKASQQIATDEFWRIMYGFRKLLEDRHRNLILSSSFQDPS